MVIEPSTSTGSIAVTTGVQQITGPGVLTFAQLKGGSTANVLQVYDGTSTSGTLLVDIENTTAGLSTSENLSQGVAFNTGLYVVVSGTSSTAIIHYRRT